MKYIVQKIVLIITLLFYIQNAFAQCNESANVWNDSWTSCELTASPNTVRGNTHWLLYEFAEAQVVDSLHIWNANKEGESKLGVQDLIVDYSVDGEIWTEFGNYVVPQANESDDYEGFDEVAFGNLLVKKVLFTFSNNYETANNECVSIAEIQFQVGELDDEPEDEEGTIVQILKRNAPEFAISSTDGGANEQNVFLLTADDDDINQQWLEIDRGDGFYSYQKVGTNHCIDGMADGANRQNVYLWNCMDNNYNQHWQKVDVGDGAFKLIKRNALGFTIDGGNNGADGQNVGLYDSSNISQNLQWIIVPEGETLFVSENEADSRVVHLTKSNAPDFAIDGNWNGEDGQNIYLWSADQTNVNQQWVEIDRGNGFYSYQKINTNYCIDGGAIGASNGQNVYLWTCEENNQNQQWLKVEQPDGSYRLEKRNDSDYAINGGNGGANAQEVNVWNAAHPNLNWIITVLDDVSAKTTDNELVPNTVIIYPNPVTTIATIKGAENSEVIIYDMGGSTILTKKILLNEEIIDLSSLASGVYHVQVKGELSISVFDVVKE